MLSTDASHSPIPPPAAPPPAISSQSQYEGIVKTPRPAFTIGLHDSAIAGKLNRHGLSNYQKATLLDYQGKLCSDPTPDLLNVRFPILVIESKTYASKNSVFEAENQAAVSGSYLVNLQQRFLNFCKNLPDSEACAIPTGLETPLAFSICTKGPIIELWAHHRSDYCSEGRRIPLHYVNILSICHESLEGGLQGIFMHLESLMSWNG